MSIIDNKMPEIQVIAGPNGSGKSTITQLIDLNVIYVNADDIKKTAMCSDMEAAKIAEKMRNMLVSQHEDFCFETVMSTDRNINLLIKAKEEGYFIKSFYVVTVSPEINIERVKTRVSQGGHDVPNEKIISRYYKSINLIKQVVSLSDICHIYDNSGNDLYRIFKKRKTQCFYDECEFWDYNDISKMTAVDNMEKTDLNIV